MRRTVWLLLSYAMFGTILISRVALAAEPDTFKYIARSLESINERLTAIEEGLTAIEKSFVTEKDGIPRDYNIVSVDTYNNKREISAIKITLGKYRSFITTIVCLLGGGGILILFIRLILPQSPLWTKLP